MKVFRLVLAVQCFPEEAPKLWVKFLIVLPTFSEKGLRIYWRTSWISPHNLDSVVPSDIFDGSTLLSPYCSIIASSSGRVFFGLFVLALPTLFGFLQSSWKDFSAFAKQCSEKYTPFFLFPSYHHGEDVDGMFPLFLV